jgi:uncharacterized membrane protein
MRVFLGLVLLGFGAFNTYDGIVDHLMLQIHHVKDGPNTLPADIGFLVGLGFAVVAAGTMIIAREKLVIQRSSSVDTSYSNAAAA